MRFNRSGAALAAPLRFLGCARSEEVNISIKRLVGFLKRLRLMPVDALSLQNGEKVFCHCIVVRSAADSHIYEPADQDLPTSYGGGFLTNGHIFLPLRTVFQISLNISVPQPFPDPSVTVYFYFCLHILSVYCRKSRSNSTSIFNRLFSYLNSCSVLAGLRLCCFGML